jgi:hypothetical protein
MSKQRLYVGMMAAKDPFVQLDALDDRGWKSASIKVKDPLDRYLFLRQL